MLVQFLKLIFCNTLFQKTTSIIVASITFNIEFKNNCMVNFDYFDVTCKG